MRTLKEIREYCEKTAFAEWEIDQARFADKARTDLPRLVEWCEKAKYWIGRHVVPLTVNNWEQEEIRKLLKEIEG